MCSDWDPVGFGCGLRDSGLNCVYHKEMRRGDSTQSENLTRLELALGYSFRRPELLVQALTHRTYTHETVNAETGERGDNQRLEFLGDAVLGLVVGEVLYRQHPGWQEGELSRMRVQFVNRVHLGKVARAIKLGQHLRLSGERERSGGRGNEYILANAMEAVIAAMFLDAGGELGPVRRFVEAQVLGERVNALAEELQSGGALGDYKSALQLHLQATGAGMPVYRLLNETGPDHLKHFEADVRVRGREGLVGDALAVGSGASRKKAEQEAARRALLQLTGEAKDTELVGRVS
jgi:ribonuclease-3